MSGSNVNLLDSYNGKGIAAKYAEYAEFAGNDVNGKSLSLKMDSDLLVDGSFIIPNETVTINGKSYPIVTIGSQVWLAKNLDDAFGWELGNYGRASYYNNDATTYGSLGLLYDAEAVKQIVTNTASWLPDGWHIPSEAEIDALIAFAGGTSSAGKALKSTSGWYNNTNGEDTYGFDGYPSGTWLRDDASYRDVDRNLVLWTSAWRSGNYGNIYCKYRGFGTGNGTSSGESLNTKYSIRLVKTLN